MSQSKINIRMDSEVKRQAEALFSSLGLNMSVAVNIFVRQALMQRRLPFDVAERPAPLRAETGVERPPFPFGSMKGKIQMADDFDEPLDDLK